MRTASSVAVAGWALWQVLPRFPDALQVCEGPELANGWRSVRRTGLRGACLALGRWSMESASGQMSNILRFGKRLVDPCSWMLTSRPLSGPTSGLLDGVSEPLCLTQLPSGSGAEVKRHGLQDRKDPLVAGYVGHVN